MFSIFDEQTGDYFHAGRNSKTRKEAIELCAEMLICGSPAICPCGKEYDDPEDTEPCECGSGFTATKWFSNQFKKSEEYPDQFCSDWNCHIEEHKEKITYDEDEELK